jgi:hypothetical protein
LVKTLDFFNTKELLIPPKIVKYFLKMASRIKTYKIFCSRHNKLDCLAKKEESNKLLMMKNRTMFLIVEQDQKTVTTSPLPNKAKRMALKDKVRD